MKKMIVALFTLAALWSADKTDLSASEYWRVGVAATIISTYATNIMGTDESAVEYGQTQLGRNGEVVDVLKLIFKWDNRVFYQGKRFKIDWYWMLDITRFEQRYVAIGSGASAALGVTPTFRYSYEFSWIRPYLEFGVGAYWIAQTEFIGRDLTTNFQFGDMLAMGAYLGKSKSWFVYYKAFHHSDGETAHPNEGLGMQLFGVGYHY